VIFLAISSTFYAGLATFAPELDVRSPEVRSTFSPLNPPKAGASAEQIAAAQRASVEAFHQAMFVGAGLFVLGSAVSWFGLRDEKPARAADTADAPAAAA
jgi:hypothetical protein